MVHPARSRRQHSLARPLPVQMAYHDRLRFATDDALRIGRLHTHLPGWEEANVAFMRSGGYSLSSRISDVQVRARVPGHRGHGHAARLAGRVWPWLAIAPLPPSQLSRRISLTHMHEHTCSCTRSRTHTATLAGASAGGVGPAGQDPGP